MKRAVRTTSIIIVCLIIIQAFAFSSSAINFSTTRKLRRYDFVCLLPYFLQISGHLLSVPSL